MADIPLHHIACGFDVDADAGSRLTAACVEVMRGSFGQLLWLHARASGDARLVAGLEGIFSDALLAGVAPGFLTDCFVSTEAGTGCVAVDSSAVAVDAKAFGTVVYPH